MRSSPGIPASVIVDTYGFRNELAGKGIPSFTVNLELVDLNDEVKKVPVELLTSANDSQIAIAIVEETKGFKQFKGCQFTA